MESKSAPVGAGPQDAKPKESLIDSEPNKSYQEGGGQGDGRRRKRSGNRGSFRGGKWRDQPYQREYHDRKYYGGGYHSRGNRWDRRHHAREEIRAEDLQAASLAQKDDKIVTFDCRLRPKSELTDWIRLHRPSVLKRSDKIGYIAVLSMNCTSVIEEKFALGSEEVLTSHGDLIKDWELLSNDPTSTVEYSTLKALARKHSVLGGKWLFQVEDRQDVDSIWMFLCSAVASEENSMRCLAVKITPVQDVRDERQGRRCGHMVSVYTRDFTEEDNVYEVEKFLRKVPIRCNMTYKPDLYTALGIYRNNKYKLRPSIYSSHWQHQCGQSIIESVFDMQWSYTGGTGDLRQKEKNTLEALVDSVIGMNLDELVAAGKKPLSDKDQEDGDTSDTLTQDEDVTDAQPEVKQNVSPITMIEKEVVVPLPTVLEECQELEVKVELFKDDKPSEELPESKATKDDKLSEELPESKATKDDKLSEELPESKAAKDDNHSEELPESKATKDDKLSEELPESKATKDDKPSEELPESKASKDEKLSDQVLESKVTKDDKPSGYLPESKARKDDRASKEDGQTVTNDTIEKANEGKNDVKLPKFDKLLENTYEIIEAKIDENENLSATNKADEGVKQQEAN